jgi:uncharacterized ion transporter superfamily protein YfcC
MKIKKQPHVFIILIAIIFLACILTLFIPAGSFDREFNEAAQKTVVINNSFKLIEASPIYPHQIPMLFFKTLINPKVSKMIFFILIFSGSFEILIESNCIASIISLLLNKFRHKPLVIIPIFLTIFSIIGFSTGLTTISIVFVPIGLAIAKSLGYNDLIGISMIMLGANVGFTAGMFNPFTVGIANSIAELPMFSGSWIRWIAWILLLFVTSLYLTHMAKKQPNLLNKNVNFEEFSIKMNIKQKIVLFSFALFWIIIISGINIYKWSIPELSSAFLVYGIIVGIIMGYNSTKICNLFINGSKKMLKGVFVIGLAATTRTILSDGHIIDTISNFLILSVYQLPKYTQLIGMFYSNTIINILITSGSGQAALIMPILLPMSDILNISRQSIVFAYHMGDGVTNLLSPISTTLTSVLALSNINYDKWFKFYIPLVGLYLIAGTLLMILAVIVGY